MLHVKRLPSQTLIYKDINQDSLHQVLYRKDITEFRRRTIQYEYTPEHRLQHLKFWFVENIGSCVWWKILF